MIDTRSMQMQEKGEAGKRDKAIRLVQPEQYLGVICLKTAVQFLSYLLSSLDSGFQPLFIIQNGRCSILI